MNRFRFLVIASVFLLLSFADASGQKRIIKDFIPVCDSLNVLVRQKTTVDSDLKLKAVLKRGDCLDFYFTLSLSDIPWKEGDDKWFVRTLRELLPARYRGYSIGGIYSNGEKIDKFITGDIGFDGMPSDDRYRIEDPYKKIVPIVENLDAPTFRQGLDNRHIALWQSHGLYYEQSLQRWEWQRPCLFQTVEDLFTQSYVLPFIVPMLENAGAYVMLPRERDFSTFESIIDNDPGFRVSEIPDGSGQYGNGYDNQYGNWSEDRNEDVTRTDGIYSESGSWTGAGTGFADAKGLYEDLDNPFRMGSARKAECVAPGTTKNKAAVSWTPIIERRGEYAVYISYKTLENSSESAHYTVHHKGGKTEFAVNQKMGGGTWIYLGTFEFDKGDKGYITLDNITPEGRKFIKGSCVTADAVKVGGGMGNIARRPAGDTSVVAEPSYMPRFTEGARYWLQWAGADSSIFSPTENENDYKDDFMSRGDWVAYMSGGSAINPKQKGKSIPFDIAFALHSDAGVTPNDSTIGTLAIYTLESGGKKVFPSGEDRHTNREFANIVQTQIVGDLRNDFDPSWNKRWLWNRGYRESRTPTAPSMLCELLSHQNFSDMRYGLDPSFKFTVSRAIYKGILKYLSNRYGRKYVVQPLPIRSFSADLKGNKAVLKWAERKDSVEPTASASGFIIQTKKDGGAFDKGVTVKGLKAVNGRYSLELPVEPGHIYSYRITAFNDGGKSFPSEILSVGLSSNATKRDSCVLIVNNFDRVSAPAWFETADMAGFDNGTDSGVPYMKEAAFTGEMYRFRRHKDWTDDDCPGFGASYSDMAGKVIAGNTFDYPSRHGKAVAACGYSFCSASAEAFTQDSTLSQNKWCADIICGKQAKTVAGTGSDKPRFEVFCPAMQKALAALAGNGTDIIVSGSNIATDVWDEMCHIETDSLPRARAIGFVESVLGYRLMSDYASRTGQVRVVNNRESIAAGIEPFSYNTEYNEHIYRVENPDGIIPAGPDAATFLRYRDSRISAGVCFNGDKHKAVSVGFPLETIDNQDVFYDLFDSFFKYFIK